MDAPLRLAVIGLGYWGKNVARSFAAAARARLEVLCDADPARLAAQRKLYPQARAVQHWHEVLADPAIDAVAIVTPAPAHHAMVREALLAGKHVFVEKPLTLTSAHAEELVELAEHTGRKLMVGHVFEFHPAVEYMKEQIDSGLLGDIHYMYCQRLNLGIVRSEENAFWSLAPHDVSMILRLFGGEPCEVAAHGAAFLQPGIEDVVFSTLRFADGRAAHIHVSWLDPHKERRVVVVGSRRMLVFDDMQPAEKIRVFDKGVEAAAEPPIGMPAINVRHGDIHIPHISGAAPLDLETQHFVDAVLDDFIPRSDGRSGLRVVRVLEEAARQLEAARGECGREPEGDVKETRDHHVRR